MYKIAVIPGDGTGPEVVAEGMKVLKAASEKFKFKYQLEYYGLGGEHYLKTKETLPDTVLNELREMDAIYLGAIGHPDVKPGILEQGILLKIRFQLDQYINLRPVKLYPGVETPLKDKGPKDIDFVVVRENSEGAYSGVGGFIKRGTSDEIAIQEAIHTRKGVERCIRYALWGGALQKHSWDPDAGYFSYVLHDDQGQANGILRHESGANFNLGQDGDMPLLAGICTPAQEQTLLGHLQSPQRLWSPIGLSTVDQTAPYYRHDGYWNGAVWMPHQWFLWRTMLDLGQADFAFKIAQTALDLWKAEVDESYHCFEHFLIQSSRGAG